MRPRQATWLAAEKRDRPCFPPRQTRDEPPTERFALSPGEVHARSMLVDLIKARMFQAMKAGHVLEKEILRVAVGEITTEAARPGRKGDDEEARAILKKLVKSNEESLSQLTDAEKRQHLEEENRILSEFLPKTLGEEAVLEALGPIAEAIRAAGNDGQATGVAMKHLKALGADLDGKVVAAATKRLRGEG